MANLTFTYRDSKTKLQAEIDTVEMEGAELQEALEALAWAVEQLGDAQGVRFIDGWRDCFDMASAQLRTAAAIYGLRG